MAKIKIKMLVEVEYDVVPTHYPVGSTIDDMIAIDVENANFDPDIFICREDAVFTITGEAV